jgi:hypothetical protein
MTGPERIPQQPRKDASRTGDRISGVDRAAIATVGTLYSAGLLARGEPGIPSFGVIREGWFQAEQAFPTLAGRIGELRQAFATASVTRLAYEDTQIARNFDAPFREVRDQVAQQFLADILRARMSERPGYIDESLRLAREAQAMGREIAPEHGWATVTIDGAVEAALDGRLRVTYQPPPAQERPLTAPRRHGDIG